MTRFNRMLHDERGASAVTMAIIGGLICLIWVEISRITGVSVSDMIQISAYNLGISGN